MVVKLYKPSLILSQFVESYTIFEEETYLKNKLFNIIPNGKPEIAIHYGDPCLSYLNHEGEIKNGYLYGLHKKTGIFKASGSVKCLCVLFKSYGALNIFGCPQIELRDKAVNLDLLCGSDGSDIIEQVVLAKDDSERISFMEKFLLKQYKRAENINIQNKGVMELLNLIIREKGSIKIKDLCIKFNLNIKTLERNFKERIGLTPKEISRIIRLNHLYKLINRKKDIEWHDMVYECSYYDQAHLINEFKEFTKMPPNEFIKNINNHMIYLNRIYSF